VLLSTDAATGQLRAQVADFGLARLDDDTSPEPDPRALEHSRGSVLGSQLTRHGAVMGTPAYMSPEQHDAVPVDPRTDQYSFCVALYEALYGKRPYAGATLLEVAMHARSGKREPPPPGNKVPGWLHRLCLRGMQPDRKDRFPKMEALLAELQAGRSRGRRRLLALGGLGLAAAVAGGTAWAMAGPRLCSTGSERVEAVWNPQRRATAEQAFAATGLPYAAGAWTGAAALLDDYGQAWSSMYADTCAATQLRGEQSAELMDLRMTCLQQRLRDMDALLGLFEAADPQIVKRAAEATIALPDLGACADAEALRNGALAPRPALDPAIVDDLRARLQAARARASAGKSKEAVPLLAAIVDEAIALADPALTAPARLALSRAQAATGADAAASASASAAVWQAIADRDDETLWEALRHTIVVVGYKLGRKAEAGPWIEHARALLRRRGEPPALKASLLRDIGMVEIAAGNPGGADAPLSEAVALFERVYGPDHPRLSSTLNTLGAARLRAGRYAEAQALLERAVRVAETAGGPNHPDVGQALNNLALTFERQNRHDEAIAALRRSLAIVQQIDPEDPNGGIIRQNIGGMLNLAGRPEEARVELAAALELLERTVGPEHPAIAGVMTFTGDVARALGDLPRARAAYDRGYTIREQALGKDHPDLALCLLGLAQVDLAEHDDAAALARVDRALALVADTAFDPGDIGLLHFARARALRALGRAEQASAAAEAARVALTTAGLAGQKPLAELTAWQAERP
jgi:tetratricopeptide (TPR) repeat protein